MLLNEDREEVRRIVREELAQSSAPPPPPASSFSQLPDRGGVSGGAPGAHRGTVVD